LARIVNSAADESVALISCVTARYKQSSILQERVARAEDVERRKRRGSETVRYGIPECRIVPIIERRPEEHFAI
jgi:hypothetical protein